MSNLTFLRDEELHVLHVHHMFVISSTISTLSAKEYSLTRLTQIAKIQAARETLKQRGSNDEYPDREELVRPQA